MVEVDFLDDLLLLEAGVDGNGVRCVCGRLCCVRVVWRVEDVGEACDESGVVEFGVGDDGGCFLGVVYFVCVDDQEVCWMCGKLMNEGSVCVVVCLDDFLSPVGVW